MIHLANLILAEVTYQRFLQGIGQPATKAAEHMRRLWVWENPATWGVEI